MVCAKPSVGSYCPEHQRARDRVKEASRDQKKRAAYRDEGYMAYRRWVLKTKPRCHLCGIYGADSVDHIIPLSKGGRNERNNWAPAHRTCNFRKGDGSP